MRLSTLPTAFGEKMVMRIFDPDTAGKNVDALGFGAHDTPRWEALTAHTHGIILVTGPTGSGKTTTLYATLKRLATDEVNVCTIEDPIEMINPRSTRRGRTSSARVCRRPALMRQDPDIIMVGEIRDLETAEMAIRPRSPRHLVFRHAAHQRRSVGDPAPRHDLGVPALPESARPSSALRLSCARCASVPRRPIRTRRAKPCRR
ncbi:MAG: Flp pilus assembly complex ATPase component TadA [Ideonella sp.]|nr:Flp pilus assembly complex ATPase component TadA [Ideonella sp.]